MSTRAVYTFKDDRDTYAVYGHHDGYPSGAVEKINNAFTKSWGPGRFEADELAAAFVAANKDGGGSIYLTKGYKRHGDLSFDYVIKHDKNGVVIEAYEYRWNELGGTTRCRIFKGTLEEFTQLHGEKAAA